VATNISTLPPGHVRAGRLLAGAGALAVLAAVGTLLAGAGALDAKAVWFFASCGIGAIVAGYFLTEGAARFALVAGMLFPAGAAQLWLTRPLWFPAPRLRPEGPVDLLMGALIVLQAAVALAVLHRQGALRHPRRLLQVFGPFRATLFLLLSLAFSVSLMGYLPRGYLMSWGLRMIVAGGMIGINMLSIAALLSLPPPFTRHRGFHPLIPAGVVLTASAALSWFAFERIPHVEDEVVYLFQARTLARGALAAPAPPEAAREALAYYLMEQRDGLWFAVTSPGWPAALAAGVRLGLPWLVNPLLAALAVLFAYGVARRLGGPDRADIVVLLMAGSPWFIGAAASLMPHVLTLTLTLAAWFLLLVGRQGEAASRRRAATLAGLAGLAMGWAFVTRQLDAALIGTLTGAWLLAGWRRPNGLVRTAAYSLGALLAGSFHFLHNRALTGDILLSPLQRHVADNWGKGANGYGFGPGIGPPEGWGALDMAPGHSPTEAIVNTLQNLSALQLEMFGWGVGSLALFWAMLLWGRWRRADAAMLAVVAGVVVALFFYWFSGSFYIGPRYWFAAFPALLYLSASGYEALAARLKRLGVHGYSSGVTLFLLALFGLLVFTPWRGVEKYHRFGGYRADIRQAMEAGLFDNRLVFVDTDADPGSFLYLNDPWLPAERPLFLPDMGPEANAAVAAAFPGRAAMLFSTRTGRESAQSGG